MKIPETGFSTWQIVTTGFRETLRHPKNHQVAELFKYCYCKHQFKSFVIAHISYGFAAAAIASLVKRASPLVTISLAVVSVAIAWIWNTWKKDRYAVLEKELDSEMQKSAPNQIRILNLISLGADIYRPFGSHVTQIPIPYYGGYFSIDGSQSLLTLAAEKGCDRVIGELLRIVDFSEKAIEKALRQAGSAEVVNALLGAATDEEKAKILNGTHCYKTSILYDHFDQLSRTSNADEDKIDRYCAAIEALIDAGADLNKEVDSKMETPSIQEISSWLMESKIESVARLRAKMEGIVGEEKTNS